MNPGTAHIIMQQVANAKRHNMMGRTQEVAECLAEIAKAVKDETTPRNCEQP